MDRRAEISLSPNILEFMLAGWNDCLSSSLFVRQHKNKKRHDEYEHIFVAAILCCLYNRAIMT